MHTQPANRKLMNVLHGIHNHGTTHDAEDPH